MVRDEEESNSAVKAASQRTDTLEISAQGRAAVEQMHQQAPPADAPQGPPPTGAPVGGGGSTGGTDTADLKTQSYAVLSALTENELDSLVSDGVITRAEAQKEMARRTAEQQTVSETDAAETQNIQQAQGAGEQRVDAYQTAAQYQAAARTGSVLNIVA